MIYKGKQYTNTK